MERPSWRQQGRRPAGGSDFTVTDSVDVTIAGEPFPHRLGLQRLGACAGYPWRRKLFRRRRRLAGRALEVGCVPRQGARLARFASEIKVAPTQSPSQPGCPLAPAANIPTHRLSDAPLQCAIESARWFLCRALPHQRAGQRPLPRTKRNLGISQMDQIALGEAAAATMRDMVHALQPLDAGHVVAIRKGKQFLAERQQKHVSGCDADAPFVSGCGSPYRQSGRSE